LPVDSTSQTKVYHTMSTYIKINSKTGEYKTVTDNRCDDCGLFTAYDDLTSSYDWGNGQTDVSCIYCKGSRTAEESKAKRRAAKNTR
jgi:hypothetical protein